MNFGERDWRKYDSSINEILEQKATKSNKIKFKIMIKIIYVDSEIARRTKNSYWVAGVEKHRRKDS